MTREELGIDPSELGLEAYPELGALVQFSSTASRACSPAMLSATPCSG